MRSVGSGLQDISSLDYGPHEHAEGLRARDALLRGHVAIARDPRAVVAGTDQLDPLARTSAVVFSAACSARSGR